MTESANGRRTKWTAPATCQAVTDPAGPVDLGPTRLAADDGGQLETVALLRAFMAGNERLSQPQAAVNAATHEVISKYHGARGRIDAIARFGAIGSAAEACLENARVVRRHAADGPEDRRRRAVPPKLLWVVLTVAAVFDASFIGSLLQQIFDVNSANPLYYFAYLPGIGIAVCLYAAGVELAVHLFRRRDRWSRGREKPRLTPGVALRRLFWDWRRPATRAEDDLPWSRLPGPVLFASLILALLGVAALVRAQYSADEFDNLASAQPAFVVLLMLLSIGAIVVKVQSHNPYADSSERARGRLHDAEARAAALVDEARDAIAAHAQSWNALQFMISSAKLAARHVVEEACASMLEGRARRTGHDDEGLTLPLARLAWPDGNGDGDGDGPRLNLDLFDHATRAAERYRPELLERDMQATTGELNAQFTAGRDQEPRTVTP